MFGLSFITKYGRKIAIVAHHLADIVETDGPELVDALRVAAGVAAVAGVGGPVGAVVGAATGAVEVAEKAAKIIEGDKAAPPASSSAATSSTSQPAAPNTCPTHGLVHEDGSVCGAPIG